jgi:membrane protein required for colicin V production
MTIYDAVMAGLLVAGMVWGAWRGITWQLASIASLVLGYSVSHPLSAQLAPQLEQFGGPVVARALAMLLIYAAVSGGVFLAAWIVRTTLRQLKFEAFDRHLGMIMGGLEGALLGLVGTFFVVSLAPQTRAAIFASPSGRIVGQVMNVVGPVLPGEVRQELAPYWNASGGMIAGDAGGGSAALAQPQADAVEPAGNGGPQGTTPAAAKLENLLEEGESRLGRVIVETAEKGLQPAGSANDRTVERR